VDPDAKKESALSPLTAIVQVTSEEGLAVVQFESVVGSVALPTVMANVIVPDL
jgi:hypothetical protein